MQPTQVRLDDRLYATPALHGVLDSMIFLQNVPSAAAVHALGPRAGERVLDLCAAPGGKSTHGVGTHGMSTHGESTVGSTVGKGTVGGTVGKSNEARCCCA